jgi:hypothetical protein
MEPLKAIADNPVLLEALRELFGKHFEIDTVNEANLSDEQLGQMFRARIVGLQKLEAAFTEIERMKAGGNVPKRVNRAR